MNMEHRSCHACLAVCVGVLLCFFSFYFSLFDVCARACVWE